MARRIVSRAGVFDALETPSSPASWSLSAPARPRSRPGVASHDEGAEVPASAEVEQSNSSVVVDERHVLKLFRRLEAGRTRSSRCCACSGRPPLQHAPRLEGDLEQREPPVEATLAIVTGFVESRGDGWELALDSLRDNPDWLPQRARRLGEVTGAMHAALAAADDPHFTPEEPSAESVALLPASIDEEIESVFLNLPDRQGSRPQPCGPATSATGPVALAGRPAGPRHPRPRRLPPGPGALLADDDWIVIDFEGEPDGACPSGGSAFPAPRRRRNAALVRLRRGRGSDPARDRRSRGVGGTLSRGLPRGVPGVRRLDAPAAERCRRRAAAGSFELQKLVYELRYELGNRPDWVGIPVAGSAPAAGTGRMTSLGELDLHLAGEGRHERIYERLGAHCADDEGDGRSRCGRRTRAPSPSSATGTAGTRTPTRSSLSARPGSGKASRSGRAKATATSSPSRGPTAPCALKADPYAFPAEVPPATALDRPPLALRMGRRRLARPRRASGSTRAAALDLRGARRLVADRPRLARARRAPRPRTSPSSASRTSSSCP